MYSLTAKTTLKTSKHLNRWDVLLLNLIGIRQTAKTKLIVRVKFYDPRNRDNKLVKISSFI